VADAWPLITPPADSSPLDHTHLATSGAGLSLRPPVYPSQAPTLQEPVGPSRLRTGVDRKRARPGRSPGRTRILMRRTDVDREPAVGPDQDADVYFAVTTKAPRRLRDQHPSCWSVHTGDSSP